MNYEKLICRRVADVPPSGIRKFFDIVSEMKGAISLGVGEPDFTTPWRYSEAAIYSLKKGATHYSSNWGLPELRRLIARYEKERFHVEYDWQDEVLVTVGASEGIDLAMRAIVEPGDEIIVPNPTYVSYAPCIAFAGGVCVPVSTDAENSFKLTPDALRKAITDKTKAIILPYPNNPTGGVMRRADLQAIADVLRDTDILVLADEIYAELTYGDEEHVSFASIDDMRERTVTLNGFSKAFAMTGWRMGYACAPRELLSIMCRIHQYTMLCAPVPAQYASIEALKWALESNFEDVRRMHREYDRRRKFIVAALNDMGLRCHEPMGAFYAFPSIKNTGMTSQEFCEALLREQKVAAVPGDAFGTLGEGHVRMSYATSMENLVEAMRRTAQFMQDHQDHFEKKRNLESI